MSGDARLRALFRPRSIALIGASDNSAPGPRPPGAPPLLVRGAQVEALDALITWRG